MRELSPKRLRVASYSFDPATRTLYRNGTTTRLTRKAGDLLVLLSSSAEALVTHEAIFAHVWPEGFVHESNLTQTVYLLRKSLADDPAISIENVPRRGYRLRFRTPNGIRRTSMTKRASALAIGAAALAAVLCACLLIVRSPGARPLPSSAREDLGLALYHFDRFVNLNLARTHFELTTRDAPNLPDGYAGSALIEAIEGFGARDRGRYCTQGRRAVARANALGASTLGHVANAMLLVTCDRALPPARRELDEALADDPSDATALTLRSRVALWENRLPEAVSFALKAAANDPTSPEALLALGIAYYDGRDFNHAVTTFSRLLELMPDRPVALDFLERSYEGLGNFANADRTLSRAQRDPANANWVWAARARLLAASGHPAQARALLRSRARASNAEPAAAAYAALGDERHAIENLKIAASINALSTQVSWLDDFRFATLRNAHPNLTTAFVTWRTNDQ